MMFCNDIQNVPLQQSCPLGEEDLLIIMDKNLAIGLSNIQNEADQFFTIKTIMEEGVVFDCKDFENRCELFADIIDTRLERYFDTKKSKYIFFDEEEQKHIKNIFRKNKLNCIVKIYIRENEEDTFKELDFEDVSGYDYMKDPLLMKAKKALRKLNVKYVISPDRYIELKQKRSKRVHDFKQSFERKKKEAELKQIQKYFDKYPGLSEIESETGFKSLYRNLAKKHHSDVATGDDDAFIEMKTDFDAIKETLWFRNLGKPEEKLREDIQTDEPQEINTNAIKKEGIFDNICKNKDGKIFKLFKAMTTKD